MLMDLVYIVCTHAKNVCFLWQDVTQMGNNLEKVFEEKLEKMPEVVSLSFLCFVVVCLFVCVPFEE